MNDYDLPMKKVASSQCRCCEGFQARKLMDLDVLLQERELEKK